MQSETSTFSTPTFTAHNIKLDDGSSTLDNQKQTMDQHPWFLGTKRLLSAFTNKPASKLTLVDLGCLEGGYSVEFARLGYNVCGIEVRQSNFEACCYVKEKTDLPNLRFVQDDVRNLASYGPFDVVFCSGLLYHLDKPVEFLKLAAQQTNSMIVLQTHFAQEQGFSVSTASKIGMYELLKSTKMFAPVSRRLRNVPRIVENEGVRGRWFGEQGSDQDGSRWASWGNKRSFWLTRSALLQTLKDVGFDLVFEQFDNLTPTISDSMDDGYYAREHRSTFIGVKTGA